MYKLEIIINGKTLSSELLSIKLDRSFDTFDALSFSTTDTSAAAPMGFEPVELLADGMTAFTGVAVSTAQSRSASGDTLTVNCYATCAILEDCTLPPTAYPAEFLNLDLQQIVAQLLQPFGLTATVAGSVGSPFDRVAIKTGERVMTFINKLASQRDIVASNDEHGNLVLRKFEPSGTRHNLNPENGLLESSKQSDGRRVYDSVTAIEPVFIGLAGGQVTKSSGLTQAFRPFVFEASDTVNADIDASIDAKLTAMRRGSFSAQAKNGGWGDTIFKPLDSCTIESETYEYFIDRVTLSASAAGQIAQLSLALNNEGEPWR